MLAACDRAFPRNAPEGRAGGAPLFCSFFPGLCVCPVCFLLLLVVLFDGWGLEVGGWGVAFFFWRVSEKNCQEG